MKSRRKIALGGVLVAFAGAGIVLSSIFGWYSIARPWGFLLGFVFGVASGIGVTFVVAGLLEGRGSSWGRPLN